MQFRRGYTGISQSEEERKREPLHSRHVLRNLSIDSLAICSRGLRPPIHSQTHDQESIYAQHPTASSRLVFRGHYWKWIFLGYRRSFIEYSSWQYTKKLCLRLLYHCLCQCVWNNAVLDHVDSRRFSVLSFLIQWLSNELITIQYSL